MIELGRRLRIALRSHRRRPGLAAAVAATAAVGLGAAATVFSLVNGIVLRPLPGVAGQDRLVNVHAADAEGELLALSHPNYLDARDWSPAFAGLAAFIDHGMSLRTEKGAELVVGQLVSGNYFEVLGTEPALGRFFLPDEDDVPGRHPVAVVSHGLWLRRLGGDPAAVGREIVLNGHHFTVVGVAPPGFAGTFTGFPFELWVPLAMAGQIAPNEDLAARGQEWLELVGRLAPGVSLEQARSAMALVASRLQREHPDSWRDARFDLRPLTGLEDSLRGGILGFLGILGGVAGLLLLIACVNAGGMLLAWAAERRREVALRLALGAGPGALAGELALQVGSLFVAGGAAGWLLAAAATRLIATYNPPFAVPLALDVAPDLRVLGFALALALLSAFLFGFVPVWRGSRADLVPALKGEDGAAGRSGSRLRAVFVVAQVALSLVLLVSAGLLVRTLGRTARMDPGFEVEGLQRTEVHLSLLGYEEARGRALYDRLVERVGALPGVEAVALARKTPLGLGRLTTRVAVPGGRAYGEAGLGVDFNEVSAGYFEALGLPLVAGRGFTAADREGSVAVAVVNETLARRLWPGEDPLGRTLSRGSAELLVVGVARDAKYRRLWEEPRPHLYVPFGQSWSPDMDLLVRAPAGGAPGDGLVAAIRAEVAALDRDLPPSAVVAMEDYAGIALTPQRLAAAVSGAIGGLGLLLAAVGLHGLLAFTVARRSREIGVRVAIGAAPRQVAGLVLRQGLRLTAVGLALGAALALAASRLLRGLLVGVSPADAASFAVAAAVLLAAAAAACYLPARRAAALDPIAALRAE